jgi:YD repeat-containing protein
VVLGTDAIGRARLSLKSRTDALQPQNTTERFRYDALHRLKRVRKTTPKEETLYVEGLYERVTQMASAQTEHRYFIHAPERVVAVVTRGGKEPGTLYVHTDHLGSVDALTNEKGTVVERRSYDAFGQRRNPLWGQAPPGSFASK